MKKKLTVLILTLCAILLCSCASFDAAGLLQGNLDLIYLNQYTDAYLESVDLTAEEADQQYADGIEAELEYFADYFDIDLTLCSDELKEQIREKEKALRVAKQTGGPVSREAREFFAAGLETLTPTEREVYEGYLAGETTKELMQRLNIKENTLKFHNKNLYGKLGISSRKQLLEIAASLPAPQTDPAKIR